MAEPFLGEIRMFGFDFPPKGWAFCNGQLLPISQNQALFNILQTTYGGDGRVNFALPDMQGRAPLNVGGSFLLGERGGQEQHTLILQEMPQHNHGINASSSNSGNFNNPKDAYLSNSAPAELYNSVVSNLVPLMPGAITVAGGNQPHSNMQPFITLSFCIALQGVKPL